MEIGGNVTNHSLVEMRRGNVDKSFIGGKCDKSLGRKACSPDHPKLHWQSTGVAVCLAGLESNERGTQEKERKRRGEERKGKQALECVCMCVCVCVVCFVFCVCVCVCVCVYGHPNHRDRDAFAAP